MLAKTYNQEGEVTGEIELPKNIFEVPMNPDLVYQVATTQMGNLRQGNAHTKNRGEVSGGGKKPWKQKGTGRARQGSIRSPQWRHGGVVFGPRKDKVYGGKTNKKMRRKAMFMALSAKAAGNSLFVMDSLKLEKAKTREMAQIIGNLKNKIENFKRGTVLIALPSYDQNVVLAARNVAGTRTIEAVKLNLLDLLNTKYLLIPQETVSVLSKTFAKDSATAGSSGDPKVKTRKVAKAKRAKQ